MKNTSQLRNEYRQKMTRETIRYATNNVPYYSALRREKGDELSLFDCPVVSKADYRRDQSVFTNAKLRTASLTHTSGTTGESLLIRRSRAELEAILFLDNSLAGQPEEDSHKVNIQLGVGSHGDPIFRKYDGRFLNVSLYNPGWMPHLKNLLNDPEQLLDGRPGKPSKINVFGPVSQVFLLALLVENGYIDPPRAGSVTFQTTGDFITTRQAEVMLSSFNGPTENFFSLSELCEGASRCRLCGHYHFSPNVFPESIELERTHDSYKHIGRLVLTGFFPFFQKTVFVRYETGDLIARGTRECPVDEFAFEPLGRLSEVQMIDVGGGCLGFIPSCNIVDALDLLPALSRFPFATASFELRGAQSFGKPKYKVEQRSGEVHVHVEAQFHPAHFPEFCEVIASFFDKSLRTSLAKSSVRDCARPPAVLILGEGFAQ